MADFTTAGLFGKIFDTLAKNPTKETKVIANEIYSMRGEYDFLEYQMYCDESLITLDLANKIVTPENKEVVIYKQ